MSVPDQTSTSERPPVVTTPLAASARRVADDERTRLAPVYGPIDLPPAEGKRIGICCSGGGIRSASYNLGALQVLQDEGVLDEADILAAVSGGSYIAAAWAIARQLNGPDPPGGPPFAPGSPEEQYLRNHTTYLAPTGMAMVFFVQRLLFGLVMNLAFLGFPVAFLGIGLGFLFHTHYPLAHNHLTSPNWAIWLTGVAFCLSIAAIFLYTFIRIPAARVPPVSRAATALLLLSGAFAFCLLALPELSRWLGASHGPADNPHALAIPAGAVSVILGGLLTQFKGLAKEPEPATTRPGRARAATTRKLQIAIVSVAGYLAVPVILVTWLAVTAGWTANGGATTRALELLGVGVLAFLVLWRFADLTLWSLHPYYRTGLASVFALKRDEERVAEPVEPPQMTALVSTHPELLVCAAANISDVGATPHGRNITSFTFSPTTIGGPAVGYEDIVAYEARFGTGRTDVMSAVAMSGAAISPSMGKITIGPARALLALTNIRLGVWLPNPRNKSWKTPGHHPSPFYLLGELFGLNSVRRQYLYVTDGGHYENLALVELLRRGCTEIFCFDASGGPAMEALGDAVALARAEIGVTIDIDVDDLEANDDGMSKTDCVRATFKYRTGETGALYYARQTLTDNLPYDVKSHAERDPKFPHDSTADQFFTDQRFEAYRALGKQAARDALSLRT